MECCITSNYQTGAVQPGAEHPVFTFLEAGVPVAICTDNTTVSSTHMERENDYLVQRLGQDVVDEVHRNARTYPFIKEREGGGGQT